MIGRFLSLIIGHWQLAAGIAALLIASHTLAYCEGRSDEKAHWIAKLEKAEADARAKSLEAAQAADKNQKAAADKFEAQQEALGKVIEDAQDSDSNSLDALFGSM